ncbi:hypothetical protein B0H14DRAFT_3569414, partial [Mycena olivaceomarginata]
MYIIQETHLSFRGERGLKKWETVVEGLNKVGNRPLGLFEFGNKCLYTSSLLKYSVSVGAGAETGAMDERICDTEAIEAQKPSKRKFPGDHPHTSLSTSAPVRPPSRATTSASAPRSSGAHLRARICKRLRVLVSADTPSALIPRIPGVREHEAKRRPLRSTSVLDREGGVDDSDGETMRAAPSSSLGIRIRRILCMPAHRANVIQYTDVQRPRQTSSATREGLASIVEVPPSTSASEDMKKKRNQRFYKALRTQHPQFWVQNSINNRAVGPILVVVEKHLGAAQLFSVEARDGRMRTGHSILSIGEVTIHGEEMGNNEIIPRKQTILTTWSAPLVQMLLPNSKRPKGLNKNFRSYRLSYDRGGCRTSIERATSTVGDGTQWLKVVGVVVCLEVVNGAAKGLHKPGFPAETREQPGSVQFIHHTNGQPDLLQWWSIFHNREGFNNAFVGRETRKRIAESGGSVQNCIPVEFKLTVAEAPVVMKRRLVEKGTCDVFKRIGSNSAGPRARTDEELAGGGEGKHTKGNTRSIKQELQRDVGRSNEENQIRRWWFELRRKAVPGRLSQTGTHSSSFLPSPSTRQSSDPSASIALGSSQFISIFVSKCMAREDAAGESLNSFFREQRSRPYFELNITEIKTDSLTLPLRITAEESARPGPISLASQADVWVVALAYYFSLILVCVDGETGAGYGGINPSLTAYDWPTIGAPATQRRDYVLGRRQRQMAQCPVRSTAQHPFFYVNIEPENIPDGDVPEGVPPIHTCQFMLRALVSPEGAYHLSQGMPPAVFSDLWPRLWPWFSFFEIYRGQFHDYGISCLDFLIFAAQFKEDSEATRLMFSIDRFRPMLTRAWMLLIENDDHFLEIKYPTMTTNAGLDALAELLFSPIAVVRLEHAEVIEGAGGEVHDLERLTCGYISRCGKPFDDEDEDIPDTPVGTWLDVGIFDFMDSIDYLLSSKPLDGFELGPLSKMLASGIDVVSLTIAAGVVRQEGSVRTREP